MAKNNPKRSIFRSKTMQNYVQNREKSVLPRVVAPRIFFLCWLILTFLMVAGIAIWLGKVPLYITGSGVILGQNTSNTQNEQATAVIILPSSSSARLRAGMPVQVKIGQDGPTLNRNIATISQAVLSPSDVRQQYGLTVAEPSLLVTIGLGPAISQQVYAGSVVQVQIQVGSQSLLSLFPVIGTLLKDQ